MTIRIHLSWAVPKKQRKLKIKVQEEIPKSLVRLEKKELKKDIN